MYEISVMQKGIDVVVTLSDWSNKSVREQDTPNGQNGPENFDFSPTETGNYKLAIKRLEETGNPEEGKISINIKKLTKAEAHAKSIMKKELAEENKKNVLTLDIDHFWEAFDNLKDCKTHADSVDTFQKKYLDRATDGLIDFSRVRDFSAEKFVSAVSHYPKFYNSIRQNTYEVKKAEPLIEEVFKRFKELYANFKPFKVCFAIGILSSGGTVSQNFVLIGTEITTSTSSVDLSEFNNNAFSKVLAGQDSIVQKIKNIVAHESVHTQQKTSLDSNAVGCPLLTDIMLEGFCDFIGELTVGGQINKTNTSYGDSHEKELWQHLKSEMCSDSTGHWLYNYGTVKDKPADLGYYMGYEIAKEYYKHASDQKQAIIDIIEVDDPLKFLLLSRYDQKEKK